MFKQFFRLTVVAYIWKRYKTIIISTLVLFIFFWVVSQLHADYVSYGDLNHDKQYIGLSFVIKWIAFVAGLVVYFLVNSWAFRSSKRNNAKNNASKKSTAKGQRNALVVDQNDPFAEIRKKDKLRSRADMIIEQHKPDQ